MKNINIHSVVILLMVLGSFGLALCDEEFRPIFGDLAKVGVGFYNKNKTSL